MAAKYRDIVIDAGGRDSVELRAAMTVADALYIPIQASQFDVWTLDQMNMPRRAGPGDQRAAAGIRRPQPCLDQPVGQGGRGRAHGTRRL